MRKNLIFLSVILFSSLIPFTSSATEVKWRGFANFVGFQDFSNNNLQQLGQEPNFERFTKVGLQANYDIAPDMHFVSQVLGKASDNFDATFDWALIQWRVSDRFNLYLGKQKYPIWLVSDRLDVGYTYPWVVPPLAVYGAEPLRNFTGALVETSLYRSTEKYQEIIFEIYGGNAGIDFQGQGSFLTSSDYISTQGGLSHLRGANLVYRDETFTLKLTYSGLHSDLEFLIDSPGGPVIQVIQGTQILVQPVSSSIVTYYGDYEIYAAGLEYNSEKYFVFSEYAKTFFDWENSFGFKLQPTHAYYITVGQKFEKLSPYFTYSRSYNESYTSDYEIETLGSSYKVNDKAKAKAEVKRILVNNGRGPYAVAPNHAEWSFGAGLTVAF